MKKLSSLLAMIIVALTNCSAQPEFTSSDMPAIGDQDTLLFSPAQNITIDLDTYTGNEFEWDFSSLTFLPSFIQVDSFRVKTHAVSVPFVDATLEWYSAGVAGFMVNLFSYSDDTLFLHRTGSTVQGVGFIPPLSSIKFPIAFNQTSEMNAPIMSSSVTFGERTTTALYDGFGTLTLPENKVYSDVFRIKKVEVDTNYVANFTTTYTSYIWYKQGGQVPLLRISYVGAESGFYQVFASQATNYTTGSTSIEELHESSEILLFPNPVDDVLNLRFRGDDQAQKIIIYNFMGSMVRTCTLNESIINTSGLVPGTYFIQVQTADNMITETFVKR